MNSELLMPFVVETIENIERELVGRLAVVTFSSWGKDSSAVAALTIAAMQNMRERGESIPELYVIHSDTMIENPLVSNHALGEGAALRRFSASTGLPIHYIEARPNLSNNYLVNIIGGRALASVFGADRVCQQMMKKDPLTKAANKVSKMIRERHGLSAKEMKPEYVLELFGLRESESEVRGEKMRKAKNTGAKAMLNKDKGVYQLCPIAKWTVDHVKFFMMDVSMGNLQTYSDFKSLWNIYKDAKGECSIITSDRLDASMTDQRGGCQSMNRWGCFLCTQVSKDTSLEDMLQNPEMEWMRPQNNIRNWLLASHFNPKNRRWLARSVDQDGMIKVMPNSYAPEFALELFRCLVTADRDEALRAEALGIEPQFLMITATELYGIEALWSRYGMHKPYMAFKAYDEIWNGGASYYPETENLDYTRWNYMPDLAIPLVADGFKALDAGLRDSLLESMGESACREDGTATIDKGDRSFMNVDVDDEFEFDEEGLIMHSEFSFDRCVRKHDSYAMVDGVWAGVSIKEFLACGILKLSKGTHATLDQTLRIANQLHDHGLHGDVISDPVSIVHTLFESGMISDEQANKINGVIRSPLFRIFYRDHFGGQVQALPAGVYSQGLESLATIDYSSLIAAA